VVTNTTDPHRHDHPHQHHDHHHDHVHRGGALGWLQHTFAHSHDVHERVDAALESHERGIRALKLSLIGLGLTALVQLIVVILSGSTALLADMVHNFGDATTALPLWVAFALARRGRTRRYTYGYGRVEDVAGVLIISVIFFSACVACYESIRKLIRPETVDHLWWVATAAVIGFLGNEVVAVFRIREGRQIGSAALIADGQHARIDGFTSLAVLVGVLGVAIGVPILDPVIGLAITIAILFIVRDAATSIMRRVLDGIEPEILQEIEHAPSHVSGVEDVHEVRARWLGHKVHAELHITVDPNLSVAASHAIVDEVQAALAAHVPLLGDATIHVCPRELAPGTVRMASAAVVSGLV